MEKELSLEDKPNRYLFEDIEIGMKDSCSVTITDEMIDDFIKTFKDDSLLHTSDDTAQKSGFKKRLAHGLLTSSFYSGFIGRKIPGVYCLCHSIDIKYKNAAFAGDKLTIIGEVADKVNLADKYKFIDLKVKIINQDNLVISKAKIRCEINCK